LEGEEIGTSLEKGEDLGGRKTYARAEDSFLIFLKKGGWDESPP